MRATRKTSNRSPRHLWRKIDGVLLLDKPEGLSSHRALQKARSLLGAAKAGHTGVLDPLATGLLPLCFGEATKFSAAVLEGDKAYRASIAFGTQTTTGDREGSVICERPVTFNQHDLIRTLTHFIGRSEQIPPMYSALKYQGRPLYHYARQGLDIARKARFITIYSIELITFDGHTACIDIACSKGCYIRTFAQDLGEKLRCGAHLSQLRRTRNLGFTLDNAVTLEQLGAYSDSEREALLLPPDILLAHLPCCTLPWPLNQYLAQGQAVRIEQKYATMTRLRVYCQTTQKLIGLAEIRADLLLYPVRLLATV